MPDNVLTIKELLPYIRSQTQHLLSPEDINKYAAIIVKTTTENPVSEKEHLNNIYSGRNNPLCPKCGHSMILRTARREGKTGPQFWGCSKYPACRGVRNTS